MGGGGAGCDDHRHAGQVGGQRLEAEVTWWMVLDRVEGTVRLLTGTELIVVFVWAIGVAYTYGRIVGGLHVLERVYHELPRRWVGNLVRLALYAAGCVLAWPLLLGALAGFPFLEVD